MARNLARIPVLSELEQATLETLRDRVNDIIREINGSFSETEEELNHQRGNNGAVPFFNNTLDLRENRITNLGRSKDPQDAVTRQELQDLGLVGSPTGNIVLQDVELAGQTIVSGPTGGSSVATPTVVQDIVNITVGENVATNNDGDQLVKERADGSNGTTPGTVALAYDQDGKARYLEVLHGGLRLNTDNLESLLVELIEEIQGLRYELGH